MEHGQACLPLGDKEILREVIELAQSIVGPNHEVSRTTNLLTLERESIDDLWFELKCELQLRLDFYLSQEQWNLFTGIVPTDFKTWEEQIAPSLTIETLANFIENKLNEITYEPVSLLGAPPCAAAGYFVGMTTLVQQIIPNPHRFGPSTPIRTILKSRHALWWFWKRLARTSGHDLPQLSFRMVHVADLLLVLSTGCVLFGVVIDWAFLVTFWILAAKGFLLCQTLYRRVNPLPRGISTFGDLARHLAGHNVN